VTVDGCCARGNETEGAVKSGQFIDGGTSAACQYSYFVNDAVSYNHMLIIITHGVSFTFSLTTEFLLHRKADIAQSV
jgi:hypothetical protein